MTNYKRWQSVAVAVLASGMVCAQWDDDDIFTLDPFIVDNAANVGYIAANSITATGVGVAVFNVPMNISVITSELIRDTRPFEFPDIIDFAAGVQAEGRSISAPRVRGFRATIQRNGLNTNMSESAGYILPAFLDRVEIIKGASAVFHGLAEPGGIINNMTKQAQSERMTEVEVEVGTDNHYGVMIDATGPATRTLNYRVVANWREFDGVQQEEFREDKGILLAASWNPLNWLRFRGSFEYSDTRSNTADELSVSHPAYWKNPAAIASGQGLDAWVRANFGPFEPNARMYVYNDFPNGREHSWLTNKPWDWKAYHYEFQTTINLGPNTVWNSHFYYNDIKETRIQSAELFRLNADGSRAFGSVDLRMPESDQFTWKNTMTTEFDLNAVTGRLVVGSQYDDYQRSDYRQRSTAANRPEGTILLHYANDPASSNQQTPFDIGSLFAPGRVLVPNFAGTNEIETTAFFGTVGLEFFEERLYTTAGARYTQVESRSFRTIDKSDKPATVTESQVTTQFGVVYRVMEGINLFANISESFQINPQLDALTGRLPASGGESIDIGLKFDNFFRNISGTISYFEAELNNIPLRDWTRERIVDLDPLFVPGGSTRKSKGYEVELSWTPNSDFQLLFAYAYLPTAETSNDISAVINGVQEVRTITRRPENSPKHSGAVWARYSLSNVVPGLAIGGGGSYRGKHSAHPGDLSALFNDSAWVFNAMVEYQFTVSGIDMTARLNARNLFDKEYNDGSFDPAMGRRIIASLNARF